MGVLHETPQQRTATDQQDPPACPAPGPPVPRQQQRRRPIARHHQPMHHCHAKGQDHDQGGHQQPKGFTLDGSTIKAEEIAKLGDVAGPPAGQGEEQSHLQQQQPGADQPPGPAAWLANRPPGEQRRRQELAQKQERHRPGGRHHLINPIGSNGRERDHRHSRLSQHPPASAPAAPGPGPPGPSWQQTPSRDRAAPARQPSHRRPPGDRTTRPTTAGVPAILLAPR